MANTPRLPNVSFSELLINLIAMGGKENIKVPTNFQSQVNEVKNIVTKDSSGLVCSVLDYAVNCATVPLQIETSNSTLTKLLKKWSDTLNLKLKKATTGIQGLSNQYYNERWLGSSLMVLETQWENVGGWLLPTKMFFLDGGSLHHTGNPNTIDLNNLEYKLKIGSGSSDKDFKPLIDSPNTKYFYQSPYTQWGEPYPSPYIIRRGTFYNYKFLYYIKDKGASVAQKALEHLLLVKLGTEKLAIADRAEFSYNEEDFTAIDEKLSKLKNSGSSIGDMMKYVGNFDTDISHLIPDYKRVIDKALLEPAEKAILASLGFIEIYNTSDRKEAVLNPKAFISEVEDGISDFAALIKDIVYTIIEVNSPSHRKLVNADIKINAEPVKSFIDKDAKNFLRGLWDRGKLSDRTLVEIGGNVDYDIELQRSEDEYKDGSKDRMMPRPSRFTDIIALKKEQDVPNKDDENIPDDKKGYEKLDYDFSHEISLYRKVSELPDDAKDALPKAAQKIWMDAFNNSYKNDNDEEKAIKVAWTAVKNSFVKKNNKWVKK